MTAPVISVSRLPSTGTVISDRYLDETLYAPSTIKLGLKFVAAIAISRRRRSGFMSLVQPKIKESS